MMLASHSDLASPHHQICRRHETHSVRLPWCIRARFISSARVPGRRSEALEGLGFCWQNLVHLLLLLTEGRSAPFKPLTHRRQPIGGNGCRAHSPRRLGRPAAAYPKRSGGEGPIELAQSSSGSPLTSTAAVVCARSSPDPPRAALDWS